MIPRRAAIGIGIFFLILIGIAIVLFLIKPKQTTDTSFIQPQTNTKETQNTVNIDDIVDHANDIDADTITTIEQSIYTYAKATVDNPQPSYQAVIRSGSYKKSFPDGSTPVVNFLVDIPSIKRTYKVDLTGNNTTAEHILYIICPTKAEMIYPAFNCKDDFSGTQ